MARQGIRTGLTARVALAALAAFTALALLLAASPAGATEVKEPPVFMPLSVTQPTNLKPNTPRSLIQKLVVDATGGTFTLKAPVGSPGAWCESYPEFFGPLPWNITPKELENIISENGTSYCFGNEFGTPGSQVGVTEPKPHEYILAYQENELKAEQSFLSIWNQPQPMWEVVHNELTGGSKTATLSLVQKGAYEGMFEISATDVGGTDHKALTTIEDTLPPGLTVTKVTGFDMYASLFAENSGSAPMTCTAPGVSPIKCTYKGEVITGDALVMKVYVQVPAGMEGKYTNQVSVSGGEAEPASANDEFTISEAPATYGPAPNGAISETSTRQAGAHPSVTTALSVTSDEFGHVSEEEKDIRIDFPPGLVGNTVGIPKCSATKILEFDCPQTTMVGMATLYIALYEGEEASFITPVYAIEPAPGEPVAFGFAALLLPVRLDTSVLSGGPEKEEQNYGIRVTAPSLTQAAETFSSWVTLWGIPADHTGPSPQKFGGLGGHEFGGPNPQQIRVPLLTNPQQCGVPMKTTFASDSWTKQGEWKSVDTPMLPFVGCEQLRFESSFTMLPDTLEAGGPAGYRFKLHVPQDSEPQDLEPSTVKGVKLSLPVGTVVSPGVAWGLKACSDEQFGLHTGQLANCPREAQVGKVQIKTPALLEYLEGEVYLASPPCDPCSPQDAESGKMVRFFLQAVSAGESKIIVKLEGKGEINQQTGQLTAVFEENPPLPFDEFNLILGGGPRAALANPRKCGPATTNLDMTPWSNPFIPDSTPTYTFDINQNCITPQFNPSLVAGTTSIQSGEYSPFTLAFGRSDEDGFLAGMQMVLPPGMLGKIEGVTLCQEPQASQGECPDNSLIGHVQALTGPGADPFLVTGGKVFLTGPYKGAPFGLSIVVPAVAGPYTLSGTTGKGTVIVRAAINVDKNDAHLTITADPLPVALDGIPLQIKVIDVTIDRNDFTFNPTSCEKMSIKTQLTSLEGMAAGVSTPFQVTNCVGLGFNPRFEASTNGHTSRTEGASLAARLIYPLGRKLANVKNVRVELPKQLPSRLTTLQKACPDYVFAENPEKCPAASRVGQTRAATPILPNELFGWAYFVSHGGEAFPNLILVLQDRQDGVRVDLVGDTFISKAGITSTTFGTVPDVPISFFEIYLPQGPNSALAANGNLCESKLVMPTEFNGQNGGKLKQETPIAVTGCNASGARHAHSSRGHAAAKKHKGKHKKKHRGKKSHAGNRRGK